MDILYFYSLNLASLKVGNKPGRTRTLEATFQHAKCKQFHDWLTDSTVTGKVQPWNLLFQKHSQTMEFLSDFPYLRTLLKGKKSACVLGRNSVLSAGIPLLLHFFCGLLYNKGQITSLIHMLDRDQLSKTIFSYILRISNKNEKVRRDVSKYQPACWDSRSDHFESSAFRRNTTRKNDLGCETG